MTVDDTIVWLNEHGTPDADGIVWLTPADLSADGIHLGELVTLERNENGVIVRRHHDDSLGDRSDLQGMRILCSGE